MATIKMAGIKRVDSKGLLVGSAVVKDRLVTFDEGRTLRLLISPSGEFVPRITRDARLLGQWADIKLAAVEAKKIGVSPEVFFHHHIQRAARKELTPPDWWHQHRKNHREAERQQSSERVRLASESDADAESEHFLAQEAFASITARLLKDFMTAGQKKLLPGRMRSIRLESPEAPVSQAAQEDRDMVSSI